MLQRTAGWSPQMLAESPRPFVGGSREALLHEEKQSQRFGTRTNRTTTGGELSYSFPCFLESILSLPHNRHSRNICQMRP